MATTPSWIVQSSPTSGSSGSQTPSWIVPTTPAATTPTATTFDPTKTGKLQDIWNYTQNTKDNTGVANTPTEAYSPYVNHTDTQYGQGESGVGITEGFNTLNWDKLPNQGVTKFGKIGETAIHVNDPKGLIDPSKIYFDENYGWVTPKANQKIEHNLVGQIMDPKNVAPALMAGAFGGVASLAGLGGLAGGAMKAVPGIAQSIGSGTFNPIGLGLSAIGASGYVPSWVVPAVKTGIGLSQMYGKG